MRINPDGRFYRWTERTADFAYKKGRDSRLPRNVCALFWFVVLSYTLAALKLAVLSFVSLCIITLVIIGYLYPFAFFFPPLFEFLGLSGTGTDTDIVLGLVSVVVWLLTIIIGGVATAAWVVSTQWYINWDEKRTERRMAKRLAEIKKANSGEPQEKSSNFWHVMVAYIKAGKDKVCPTIEYVRNEDEAQS